MPNKRQNAARLYRYNMKYKSRNTNREEEE